VLWVEGGGGAAGWVQDLISIQSTDVNYDAIDKRTGEDSPIFAINKGEAYRLKWESNDRLVVEVDHSPRATVYAMRRSQELAGRQISVMYREGQAEEHPFSGPQTRCESGSTTLITPASKRIR
jgi:hypothetical protein